MLDLESYRSRLMAMRNRLRRQIEDEVEGARDSIHKPGEGVNLHTHNADMDVEGLDEAVGVGHALERHLVSVEQMLMRLDKEGESLLKNDRERERIDAYLDTDDFADRLRNGDGGEEPEPTAGKAKPSQSRGRGAKRGPE